MKYKLFGIDLDGTLLSKNKKISSKNLQALNRYINDGGTPIIITGRSFVSARLYIKEIEDYTQSKIPFLVGFNGAYIQNTKTKEIIKKVIPKEITYKLWNLAIENNCNIWVYVNDQKHEKVVYVNKKWLAIFVKLSREVELKKSKKAIYMSSYKINIMSFSPSRIKRLYKYLINNFSKSIEVSYTHPLLLEITAKGINKGYAILEIAKRLNIKRENITSVGDSGNDIPMALVSGKSFGLKAKNPLLEKNVDVYLKNKNNAVAKIINNYLIDNEIKLIASDLDGTLLDDFTKLVHLDTVRILKRALSEKHCKFTIATGRGLDDCLVIFKDLHLKYVLYQDELI